MDDNPEQAHKPRLDDLVEHARTDLREWTDHTDSDPGIALLELFAYVGDLLSSYADRIADESYLGTGRDPRSSRLSCLVVEVDGHPWDRVVDFSDSGPDDLHYAVRVHEDGASMIEFGDGVHGRRPQPGDSIGVHYRRGASSSSVLVQEGRVLIDADWAEKPPGEEVSCATPA